MTEIDDSPDHRTNSPLDIMGMVSNIVATYVSNHTIEPSDLPGFIQQVQRSFSNSKNSFLLSLPGTPAVPIEEGFVRQGQYNLLN